MVKIINEEPLHLTGTSAGKLLLLVMDYAAFHKNPEVLKVLKDNNVHVVMISPGCTGLLQLLIRTEIQDPPTPLYQGVC